MDSEIGRGHFDAAAALAAIEAELTARNLPICERAQEPFLTDFTGQGAADAVAGYSNAFSSVADRTAKYRDGFSSVPYALGDGGFVEAVEQRLDGGVA